jgi:hypothetical protein
LRPSRDPAPAGRLRVGGVSRRSNLRRACYRSVTVALILPNAVLARLPYRRKGFAATALYGPPLPPAAEQGRRWAGTVKKRAANLAAPIAVLCWGRLVVVVIPLVGVAVEPPHARR